MSKPNTFTLTQHPEVVPLWCTKEARAQREWPAHLHSLPCKMDGSRLDRQETALGRTVEAGHKSQLETVERQPCKVVPFPAHSVNLIVIHGHTVCCDVYTKS